MDWKDLAGTLAKVGAPVIGTALGGPLGGMIGGAIGNVVATALGTDATPEAVNTAITTQDPQVVSAKLAAADAQWQSIAAQVQSEAELGKAQVQAISETMKAEDTVAQYANGWVRNFAVFVQSSWRPFLMYLWGFTWPYQLYVVLSLTDVTQRASILYALTAWNAGPAGVAGVYAWGRSKEKIADMMPPLPGVAGVVQKVIKGVRR
jgi:hypothetical protein